MTPTLSTASTASRTAAPAGHTPAPDPEADQSPLLTLHPDDNVATALVPVDAGTVVRLPAENVLGADGSSAGGPAAALTVRSAIPFGHKVALTSIPAGGEVRKYGEVIGRATAAVAAGELVHVHNVESQRARGDLRPRSW